MVIVSVVCIEPYNVIVMIDALGRTRKKTAVAGLKL